MLKSKSMNTCFRKMNRLKCSMLETETERLRDLICPFLVTIKCENSFFTGLSTCFHNGSTQKPLVALSQHCIISHCNIIAKLIFENWRMKVMIISGFVICSNLRMFCLLNNSLLMKIFWSYFQVLVTSASGAVKSIHHAKIKFDVSQCTSRI